MSKKLFTLQDQKILKKNPYVRAVSEKGITYTDDFKAIAIEKMKTEKDL